MGIPTENEAVAEPMTPRQKKNAKKRAAKAAKEGGAAPAVAKEKEPEKARTNVVKESGRDFMAEKMARKVAEMPDVDPDIDLAAMRAKAKAGASGATDAEKKARGLLYDTSKASAIRESDDEDDEGACDFDGGFDWEGGEEEAASEPAAAEEKKESGRDFMAEKMARKVAEMPDVDPDIDLAAMRAKARAGAAGATDEEKKARGLLYDKSKASAIRESDDEEDEGACDFDGGFDWDAEEEEASQQGPKGALSIEKTIQAANKQLKTVQDELLATPRSNRQERSRLRALSKEKDDHVAELMKELGRPGSGAEGKWC